jgi:hypothetical protein
MFKSAAPTPLPDTRALTYPVGLDEIDAALGNIVLSMGDKDSDDAQSANISPLEELAAVSQ